MNSTIVPFYPQAPGRTYLRRSSLTIDSFATALSSLSPIEDDIELRQLTSDVPTVPTPDPSLTPQLSSLLHETNNDTPDFGSCIIGAFNADDIEYGPKTLEDFLRGNNAVQRAINFYRYVQMKTFPLCLSVLKNTLSMVFYGYLLIWFVDLRDHWRKLQLEDLKSREGWIVWLCLVDGSYWIMTLYKWIRGIRRLNGAPIEKHTFLDVGEDFDPFMPGKADAFDYVLLSSFAVAVHLSCAIRILLWVKDWMAGGPATGNPQKDIIVGWLYFALLMGHLFTTLTSSVVHLRYGARWDNAPSRDPRSITPRDDDDHALPLYELDGLHQPHDHQARGLYSTHEAHPGNSPYGNHVNGFGSTHDLHHQEHNGIDIWEGIPRGHLWSHSVSGNSVSSYFSIGTIATQNTYDMSPYASWRWEGKMKLHVTDPSLYLF
ncbi:hypothetical protein SMACR_05671 [Sordaria macrospora]|uniref:WGS project CABT00000000 data, contig 2.30 n=2 Tax=Sordaria macrospora TaxID=5147 RepID=F7W5C3_SORMK|nr:uncharacterized protein SMAC_05671 [Sordaria macrospora k-hell]KAA8629158.1 hypothetical protein SMACR_05671 [Sordaria macrospora]KAH7628078.1 hypothetical protein B0T09DRAFT_410918 [Sordaria sp. MPI-SDFR-AT-0083]WPJ65524.1 hypothetical protein SMAC4_05671 [Sordaria macrospora]CCC12711.1 unnamed protein product [Sordaria macrospora k-hell]